MHACSSLLTLPAEFAPRNLYPALSQDPEFQGRQVVTFHNQRDYIFVRHHRYIFETADQPKGGKKGTTPSEIMKARLQELGPRFTLKLRWLQVPPMRCLWSTPPPRYDK